MTRKQDPSFVKDPITTAQAAAELSEWATHIEGTSNGRVTEARVATIRHWVDELDALHRPEPARPQIGGTGNYAATEHVS